jgi:hypothetical protein
VFASFAPCNNPKYVVVMMIPNSGYGADVSGPAVKNIWDDLYGLQGNKAALAGGRLPKLPHINASGEIVPSTTSVTSPAPVGSPASLAAFAALPVTTSSKAGRRKR